MSRSPRDRPGERSPCVACGAPAAGVVLHGAAATNRGLVLLRCDGCGHVYLDGWGEAFDAELYGYHAPRIGATRGELYDPMNAERQRELLAWLGARTRGRRLLDVGCGYGHLVDTAAGAGWDALGIDLAEGAITIARSFGVRCAVQDFFAPELDRERFDVIAMSELIEHVPDPGRFLERARALLHPGGLLYLTTPNFASLACRLVRGAWHPIHREHVSYFTPRVLSSLGTRRAGLELVHAETRNFDPRVAVQIARRVRSFFVVRQADASGAGAGAASVAIPAKPPPTQRVRRLVQRSVALRAAKRSLNAGLSALSAGDTIVMTFRRP